jgi:hypothetical protein
MDNSVRAIKIIKAFPLSGKSSLEGRFKEVGLRGFPNVKIYENASFSYPRYDLAKTKAILSTSQPHVHQTYLDRINKLDELFQTEGVDIFNLDHAYDYVALNNEGRPTEWTMLPPIVEVFHIPRHIRGGFDYTALVGPDLKKSLTENSWSLNDAARSAAYHQPTGLYHLINDGTHRIEAALQSGHDITVVEIRDITPGFPYYAIPQPYDSVRVFPDDVTSEDLKIHVVNAPAHKQLYRLFPSGGIQSGTVRPPRKGEVVL